MGGKYNSTTNHEKSHTGKCKTKNTGRSSDVPTDTKKTCILHGPDIHNRSVRYLEFIQISTPRIGHIKINNSAPASNLSMMNPSSSAISHRRST